jgi:hypothetical protein
MTDTPITPPANDLDDVLTPWGVLPRWKARALAIAELQTIVNDAAEEAAPRTLLRDEDKPPPLAADRADPMDHLRRVMRVRELRRLGERCDALLERYDLLEKRDALKRVAAEALRAAEERFTTPDSTVH